MKKILKKDVDLGDNCEPYFGSVLDGIDFYLFEKVKNWCFLKMIFQFYDCN